MTRHQFLTIEEKGGLRAHHQQYPPILGINYHALFVFLVEQGLNDVNIGKALGKHRTTIKAWRLQYYNERATLAGKEQNKKDH